LLSAAFAQIGIVGFGGRIELEGLRLYGLPEVAPGATSLIDVTVNGARQGDLAYAALASSTTLRRVQRRGVVQQHRARHGQEHLAGHLRLGFGNAVCAGDEATDGVCASPRRKLSVMVRFMRRADFTDLIQREYAAYGTTPRAPGVQP